MHYFRKIRYENKETRYGKANNHLSIVKLQKSGLVKKMTQWYLLRCDFYCVPIRQQINLKFVLMGPKLLNSSKGSGTDVKG